MSIKWLWLIPAALVVGFLLAVLLRRNPLSQIIAEFRGIEEAAVAKHHIAVSGADAARRKIEAKHAETIRQFSKAQRARADQLRDDPIALARWLERLSG